MKRPAEMPKVGTTIHDPLFGGGCTLRVTKVHKPSANRGWRVTVHITTDDGRRITMPTRVWSLASWIDSVSRATAAHAQACAMHGPSGRSPSDLTFGAAPTQEQPRKTSRVYETEARIEPFLKKESQP